MTAFKAEVKVRLKKGVADPEGMNTKRALELLGFTGVTGVVSIKTFEIELTARNEKKARSELDEMCRRLLANPVIHSYSISFAK